MTEYTVCKGDTLGSIAHDFYGDSSLYGCIADENGIDDPDSIAEGTKLSLPDRLCSTTQTTSSSDGKTLRIHVSPVQDQAVVLFSPRFEKYLVLDKKDGTDTWLEEFSAARDVMETVMAARDAADPGERQKALGNARKKFDKFLDGVEIDSGDALDELVVMKKTPRYDRFKSLVYYRPLRMNSEGKRGAGKWKDQNDEQVRDKLKKVWEDQKKKIDHQGLSAAVKKQLLDESVDFQWPLKWKKGTDPELLKDNRCLDFRAEVQVCRFAAGFGAEAEIDFIKEKKFTFKSTGSVSYALGEGKVSASLDIPGKNGYNILLLFEKSKKVARFIEKNRQCNILLKLDFKGAAFVGASAAAAVELPSVDFSAKTRKESGGPEATGSASGSTFAGGSAEGTLGAIFKWSRSTGLKFDDLGSASASAAGSAGAGIEGTIEIGYKSGTWVMELGAGAVAGLGGKVGTRVELGVEQAIEFFAHLFVCVDYHFIAEVGKEAFEAYGAYMLLSAINPMLAQKALAEKTAEAADRAIRKGIDIFRDAAGWLKSNTVTSEEKSSAKINSKKFIGNIGKVPPEDVGVMLLIIMKDKQDNDYQDIIDILNACEPQKDGGHKLRWAVRIVGGYKRPAGGKDSKEKEAAFERGKRRLLEFGGYDTDNPKRPYCNQLVDMLK